MRHPRLRRKHLLVLFPTLLLLPAAARADDAAPEPPTAAAAPAGEDASAQVPLVFSGRVLVLAGQTSTTIRSGDPPTDTTVRGRLFDLQSARFGLKYDVTSDISLNLELDASGRPEVKDAFVQAKSKRLRLRAGHHKMPLSSLTLESPWK